MKKWMGTIVLLMLCSSLCQAQIGIFDGQESVGDDAFAGLAEFSDGVYKIDGSGNDIWGPPDGFYWVYKEITGDFTVTATVEWITDPYGADGGDTWKKAGIIARDTLDPTDTGPQYACSALILGNFNNFFTRTSVDGSEDDIEDGRNKDISGYTLTIQLKRVGNVFSMLRELVSGGFEEITTFEFDDFSETCLVGLEVTSHDTSTYETAQFSNVSIDQSAKVQNYSLYE